MNAKLVLHLFVSLAESLSKGSFYNYVDEILSNIDHLGSDYLFQIFSEFSHI